MLIHRLRAVRCALVLAPLIAVLVFAPGVLARFKNAGAGGCGNFDTVIASAQAGDVLAPMRGGVNTNGATISETVVMQGGWVPNTGDCNDAGTNTFDNTAAMLAAGFAFDPAQPSELFGDFVVPTLQLDLKGKTDLFQNLAINGQSIDDNGSAIGGVLSNGARVRMEHMQFDQNQANGNHTGGAVYLELRGGSHLTIADSQFTNNAAATGGALEIHLYDNSTLLIERSTFSNNTANGGNGGALRVVVESGTVTIRNNVFSDNQAPNGNGGAIALERSVGASGRAVAELTGNSYTGNSASANANVYLAGLTLRNRVAFLPLVQHPVPAGPYGVQITSIGSNEAQYVVAFTARGYTPVLPGRHVHFFFNTVPAAQAGMPGSGPWKIYGSTAPFTEYGIADRPAGATQLCALVANADHSVIQGSGNCVELP